MIYISICHSPEGYKLCGLSETQNGTDLPADAVDVDTLAIPSEVTALGISTWEEFNDSGLMEYYLYSGGNLTTRTIDYWYFYSGTADPFVGYRLAVDTYDVSTSDTIKISFFQTAYAAEETPPVNTYATVDNVVYNNVTYAIGDLLVLYGLPTPTPPTDFTTLVPPSVPTTGYHTLQWSGSAWFTAAFPIALNLASAQSYLETVVKTQGSSFIDHQLRIYSTADLISAPSIGALVPADSAQNGYATMADYEAAVDALVNPKLATISAATVVADLYSFDPGIVAP